MTYDDVLLNTEEKMEKAIQVLADEFRRIRSGRATPGLVENIRVDYYGAMTPIKQMANISVPEPRLLVIRPYDQSVLKNIEKALLKSELGITPNNDGKLIRLAIPALSEERRKQLAHQVKDIAEKARVAIRNIRREANRHAGQMEKDAELSKDEAADLKDEVQKLTNEYEKKVAEMLEKKVQDIMQI